MYLFLYHLTFFSFFMSLFGYILTIVKEKILIKKNIIIIENKYLTEDDLAEIDINKFILQGKKVKSGDEIKIITLGEEIINGILIGGNKYKKAIHIITFDNKVKKLEINTIFKFKIISKYGKFLNY